MYDDLFERKRIVDQELAGTLALMQQLNDTKL